MVSKAKNLFLAMDLLPPEYYTKEDEICDAAERVAQSSILKSLAKENNVSTSDGISVRADYGWQKQQCPVR